LCGIEAEADCKRRDMLLPSLRKGMCFADPITSHCVAPLNSGLRAITAVVSSSIPVSSFSTISQEDPTSAKSVGLQALVEKNDAAASQFELSNYSDLQQSPYMPLRQYSHSLSLTCGPIFEAPASAMPCIHHHTCTSFYPSLSNASRAHPSVRCVLEHCRQACNLSDVPSFWWPQERLALFIQSFLSMVNLR